MLSDEEIEKYLDPNYDWDNEPEPPGGYGYNLDSEEEEPPHIFPSPPQTPPPSPLPSNPKLSQLRRHADYAVDQLRRLKPNSPYLQLEDPKNEMFGNMLEMLRHTISPHGAITWLYYAKKDFTSSPAVAITAGMLFWRLGDEPGALRLFKEARDACKPIGDDPLVNVAIEKVEAYMTKYLEMEDAKWHKQTEESDTIRWTGLIPLPEEINPSSELVEKCEKVQRAWRKLSERPFTEQELEDRTPEKHVLQRYQRAASIATNEVEGFFALKEKSRELMTRVGFRLDMGIELAEAGPIYNSADKRIVKEILDESYKLYDFIDNMIKYQVPPITTHSLLSFQSRLCHECRITIITPHEWEEHMKCRVNPSGRFRVSCAVETSNFSNIKLQYCPASEIETHITLLSNNLFACLFESTYSPHPLPHLLFTSAWLLTNLYLIHPFTNPEPRLYRLLASVPLRTAGLPPLSILPVRNLLNLHHEAIKIALKTADFEPLALSILKHMSITISFVSANLDRRFEDRHFRWPSPWDTMSEQGYSSEEEAAEEERQKKERKARGEEPRIPTLEELMREELGKVLGEGMLDKVPFDESGDVDPEAVVDALLGEGAQRLVEVSEEWKGQEEDERITKWKEDWVVHGQKEDYGGEFDDTDELQLKSLVVREDDRDEDWGEELIEGWRDDWGDEFDPENASLPGRLRLRDLEVREEVNEVDWGDSGCEDWRDDFREDGNESWREGYGIPDDGLKLRIPEVREEVKDEDWGDDGRDNSIENVREDRNEHCGEDYGGGNDTLHGGLQLRRLEIREDDRDEDWGDF